MDVFNTFSEEKDTLDKTILLFDKYCIPKINYAIETYKFNRLKHNPRQSFETFLTELKSQAAKCNQFKILKYINNIIMTKRIIRDRWNSNLSTVIYLN